MAIIPTTVIGAQISLTEGANVTLFEGDLVKNLKYKSGNTIKSVDGTVRVIQATTKANNSTSSSCPPEPYVNKYITVTGFVIDTSEVFDADLVKIDAANIVSIGSINDEVLACTVNGVYYPTFMDAFNAAEDDAVITVMQDVDVGVDQLKVPVGKTITIQGVDPSVVMKGRISCEASGTGETHLYLKNITLNGADLTDKGSAFAVSSANQTADNQMDLYMHCENVTFKNYIGKALYLTNAKELILDNCTFANNASADMPEPNIYGDYTVDLNLVAVQDAVVELNNCTFSGVCGSKAVVKIAQRGGPSDADASDLKGIKEATVKEVTIDGCSFLDESTPVDFNIGTTSKTTGNPENRTGAYEVTIKNCGSAVVALMPYNATATSLTVPIGRTAHKDPDGDLILV